MGITSIVIYEPNWLGDIMFTSPAIRAVKKAYPDAEITCIAHPRTLDVVSSLPYVNDIIAFYEKNWFLSPERAWGFVNQLRERDFSLGILFHPSDTRSAFLKAGRVKNIVGTASFIRKYLLTQSIDLPRDAQHRIEMYLSIVKAIGVEPDGYHYDFVVEGVHREYIGRILSGFGDFVVLNFGGNWDAKRWPLENFAELGKMIIDSLNLGVVLSGASRDIWMAERLFKMIGREKVLITAGKTTIKQLAALMERAKAIVSNDSGPMHIAAAVNKNIIGIFGPTNPMITGLFGELQKNNIFCLPEECISPCYQRSCKYDYKCIRAVSTSHVFKRLKQMLSEEI